MRVLLIGAKISDVKTALEREGYRVETARNAESAHAKIHSGDYGIVLYDIDGQSGAVLECVRGWRTGNVKAHLIVLASRLSMTMRIELLDAGVDCYVLKPHHVSELLARLRGFYRRREAATDTTLRIGDLEIDYAAHQVRRAGRIIRLTPREYALLHYLALNRGKIVRRDMILEHVFGGSEESNVVNVYIRYLRHKIDKGFKTPLIQTRYGQGYVLGEPGREMGTSPLSRAG